ncbi:homoserine O-acetyltransferase MetX [Tomitella cavernea]|uniref:Homoserine O-acetyltransferase n=1 Tax=Tomitella cavernea TaxID=1387982 RepID=A0ABP9CFM4_9ACTN|nr:homoserine O-acetyltransferase [Tomitella cavernea]
MSTVHPARPASLAWPDGQSGAVEIGPLVLDCGIRLPQVTIAFQRWGALNAARDNVVLALHALTGDTHAAGPADERHASPGWWNGLIGPGLALDTDEWCVITTNSLGGCNGSTGPSSPAPDGRPWGSRFPYLSIRDQVRAESRALEELGIDRVASVMGGSMGGARALEWEVTYPEQVDSALILAVGARATADQIGTQTTQLEAIRRDPDWQGGDFYGTSLRPDTGLKLARRFAHLTYRTEFELDERFANAGQMDEDPLKDGRYAVQSYLEYQADKFVGRFDPGSYVILTESLNRHDVGRDRGGVQAALAGCTVPTIVAGWDSDRLYPLRLQAEIAEHLAGCVEFLQYESRYGHDAFLIEFDAVDAAIGKTMELARKAAAARR